MSAELSARLTAATAALRDFQREANEFVAGAGVQDSPPDWHSWAWRLASELAGLLTVLREAAAPAAPDLTLEALEEAYPDWLVSRSLDISRGQPYLARLPRNFSGSVPLVARLESPALEGLAAELARYTAGRGQ